MLDAWAILAWLDDERPASDQVQSLLDAAKQGRRKLVMNIVNIGEVYYRSARSKDLRYAEDVMTFLRSRVVSVPANDDLVMQAAALKSRYPISYADAFAAATSITENLPLVSGDADFRLLETNEKGFQLEWIGR